MNSSSTTAVQSPPDHAPALAADLKVAAESAVHLGIGLLGSWVVGLLVRLLLPRWLGPEQFGVMQFADSFTAMVMILMTFGADTYIRKEIPARPAHASEFFGGLMAAGGVAGLLVLAVSLPGLHAAGKSTFVLVIVAMFGLTQMLTNLNDQQAALLHAVSAVKGLSRLNILVKLLWGAGIVAAHLMGAGLVGVAVALLVSETARTFVISRLTRTHLALRFQVNWPVTRQVMHASLPFWISMMSQTVYARVNVSVLSLLAGDRETGWYGAASMLAGLSLMLSPIIAWVLLPLSSKAAARSREELVQVVQQTLRVVMLLAVPASLALYVGADELIGLAFGPDYTAAALSLQILAPTFLLTYLAMVCSTLLVRLDRGWWLTGLGIGGMLVSVALNVLLVPLMQTRVGDGGAGVGAALALTIAETLSVGAMMLMLRGETFTRQSLRLVVLTVLLGLAVAVLDHLLGSLGAWRLAVDAAVYVGIGVLTGLVDVAMIERLVRQVLPRSNRGTT